METPVPPLIDTKPLDFDALLELLYKVRNSRDEEVCECPRVDVALLEKHGIPFFFERADLVLVSADGMRRAKEVGAISTTHAQATDPH